MEIPDRDILKKIVVQFGKNVGKGETRRVTDNSQPKVNVVRRPGEGSRPLFDRDEIISGRRIFEDMDQDGRNTSTPQSVHSHLRDRFRTSHEYCRCECHISTRERERYDRSRDDLFFRSRGGTCPMCHSTPYYFTECGESCIDRRRRIFRTSSDEALTRRNSNSFELFEPAEIGAFYLYGEPNNYTAWESTSSHPLYEFGYYSH